MILPSHYGNDLVSLVKFAIDKYGEEKGIYDRMYCVFDRDGHAGYQDALNAIANSDLGKSGKLRAITSIPCFEIWVLLHFNYSTAPFAPSGNKSGCDKVLSVIRDHVKGYQKAFVDVFEVLNPRTDTAVANALKLAKHNGKTGSNNPATKVHELVAYLRNLKGPPSAGA